ncbi:hypothetical protein [Nocardia harenae]|uniref:hypothetical protein n=1 Tax=Nocardia harenae TaxID=358707 RepID=UPI0008360CF6|nr:hypothetical protein [Nocardia harenae]
MRDDNPTGHAEIAALAHRVATARGKLPLQHDNALLEVLSDGEVAAERELAEWIRAQRRGQRRRAMQDELDAEKRDRRAEAALRRTEDSDARWHRKALAARRRVASQDARIAQLYRRAEWSSRALIGVVVLGMVWAGVNVQRNLVPSGDMSDPLYWLSYGIEAMISIPIIVIMIAATTAARWGRELPRGRVILVELALLGTTIGLNAGPHLASGELGKAAEFAIAPIMVGVVIWLHSWVAARYAQLIDDASVDLPIDSMVAAPVARTRAFTERYAAPRAEVDVAELVARAHDEFERMGIESTRSVRDSAAPTATPQHDRQETAPTEMAAPPRIDAEDYASASPAARTTTAAEPEVGDAEQPPAAHTDAEPADAADRPVAPRPAAKNSPTGAPASAETPGELPQPDQVQPQNSAEGDRPSAPPRSPAPEARSEVDTAPQPSAARPNRNGSAHSVAEDLQHDLRVDNALFAEAADSQLVHSNETGQVAAGDEPSAADDGREQEAAPREQPITHPTAPRTDVDQHPQTTPRAHLRAVTATEPPKQETLPFADAPAEAAAEPEPTRAPTAPEPRELTSARTTNEPEPALPDHDPVIESDEAGAWAAAKTIVARGWSKVPVEQLAEILEMADRSRSAASIGAEMGLPRSVVDQAMQAAHKLSRSYAMTS